MAADAPDFESFTVARLQTADVQALLARLNISELIESGAVNIISLDLIRDKLGDRWERKQRDVWAHVERCTGRILAPQDICQRLTDTDYLVAVMSEEPLASLSMSMRILEEALVFFLGQCSPADLTLYTVRNISDGMIDCQATTPEDVRKRQASAQKAALASAAPSPPQGRLVQDITPVANFQSSTGREFKIVHGPLPLISLRQGAQTGVRSEPTVFDRVTETALPRSELQQLADADLERIDQATMAVSVKVTQATTADRPNIILPLSFQTLASNRARSALLAMAPPDLIRQRFMFEIVNIGPGTPASRLPELIGMLRAYAGGVIARVPPNKAAIAVLDGLKLGGVALDLGEGPSDDAAVTAAMSYFHSRVAGVAPWLHVIGLTNKSQFESALKCGLTHASVRRASAVNLAA